MRDTFDFPELPDRAFTGLPLIVDSFAGGGGASTGIAGRSAGAVELRAPDSDEGGRRVSVIPDQMPRIGGTFSKPGQLVIKKFCLQKFTLPLRTGEIPAICTKRSSGASVHSRTSFTLRHFLASVEKAQLPIVEIPVDNNCRKNPLSRCGGVGSMTVYVDDMYRTIMGRFRHMKMSHMIADSSDELLAMADQIGLKRKWLQKAGTADEHFDIGMGIRAKAVAAGAVEISMRELAMKCQARRSPP